MGKGNEFVIGNTWFEVPYHRRWTWRNPGKNIRNQIDYILIRERYRNALKSCKAYPGADCGSDHNPVIATIELKLRKPKKSQQKKKLDLQLLKTDMDIKRRYAVEVMNIYQALAVENNNEDETEVEWNTWKGSLTSAAEKIVSAVRKRSKQKWMTDEILDKMAQRRKNKWNHGKYAEFDREVRRLCDQEEEEWLNKECDEL